MLASVTAARAGTTPESVFAGWVSRTPVGRLGRADELAATIAFLASDLAGFITGQAVLVDGGTVNTIL
jgi:NAD(P)-dependent dehydrogenase (short-subunit alcohol dehydrogenase family)